MKKLLLSVVAVLSLATVNAQEEKTTVEENNSYLPQQGDWSIGFNASSALSYLGNAFNGNTANNAAVMDNNSTYGNNTFVGKVMDTDKTATRYIAGFGFGVNSSKDLSIGSEVKTVNTNFSITAGMGKEWRKGSTRLQGYYGADALVTLVPLNSNKVETVLSNPTDDKVISTTTITKKEGFGFGLGARGFLGAEYFLLKQLAIGAEYSYTAGINFTGGSKETKSVDNAAGNSPDDVETKGGSSFGANIGGVGVVSLNLSLYF